MTHLSLSRCSYCADNYDECNCSRLGARDHSAVPVVATIEGTCMYRDVTLKTKTSSRTLHDPVLQ